MPLLAKSIGVPTKMDKSGGMSRKVEQPGVSKHQMRYSPDEACEETTQQITGKQCLTVTVTPTLIALILCLNYQESTVKVGWFCWFLTP